MSTRRCTKCMQEKSLDDFYKTKNNKWCISCYRESALQNYHNNKKEYYNRLVVWRENNKEQFLSTQRSYRQKRPDILNKWKENNPDKYKAHNAVSNAVRDGRLVKSESCELCGNSNTRIDGHHWHGYDKEHWLDVQWLCPKCHTKVEDL